MAAFENSGECISDVENQEVAEMIEHDYSQETFSHLYWANNPNQRLFSRPNILLFAIRKESTVALFGKGNRYCRKNKSNRPNIASL